MPIDALRLDNQLCFPLYACSRKIISLHKPFLDAIHLTYTQYLVMMVLWECGTVSVKALGGRLYLDSGTLTPLLKKLESQGLVTRARDSVDERSVLVAPTKAGLALQKEAKRIPGQVIRCMPIGQEDAALLHDLLHKLLKQL